MFVKKFAVAALALSIAMSANLRVWADDNDVPDSEEKLFDKFSWAGGIEDTFIPQCKPGLRRLEEYELTQHYDQWREDLDRAKSLGITKLRWGVPWYKVEAKEGVYDWKWTDQVIKHMIDDLKIDPIIDLVHYGTPNWLTDGFADERYPKRVAAFARAFAQRYKDKVVYYTPTNEPSVTAEFCGDKGEWPPYLTGDAGYVKVLLSVARGIQEISKVIRDTDDDATLMAVESMHDVSGTGPVAVKAAQDAFNKDLLPWDLVRGQVKDGHPLYEWLTKNGADEATLKALRDNAVKQDVFGVNFYPWSSKTVSDDGGKVVLADNTAHGQDLHNVLTRVWEYTKAPMFLTETSATGDMAVRKAWMDETIEAVRATRKEGVPVLGYTWFPLITMIDWQYRTQNKPLENYLLNLGLWDATFNDDGLLERKETSMVGNYRDLIKQGMPGKMKVASH